MNEAIAKKKKPHTPDRRYGIYCETKKQSTRGFEEYKGGDGEGNTRNKEVVVALVLVEVDVDVDEVERARTNMAS